MRRTKVGLVSSTRVPAVVALTWLFHVSIAEAQSSGARTPAGAERGSLRPVVRAVHDRKAAGSPFEKLQLFAPARASLRQSGLVGQAQSVSLSNKQVLSLTNEVKEGTVLLLSQPAMKSLLKARPQAISVRLPSKEGDVVLELVQQNIFTDDFVVTTDTGEVYEGAPSLHYGGIVNGDPSSLAAISILDGDGAKYEVMGFYTSQGRRYTVGRLQGENPNDAHLAYDDADAFVQHQMDCGTVDHGPAGPGTYDPMDLAPQAVTPRCMTIYVEAEYDMYVAKGSIQAVRDFVAGIFNQVFVIFANNETPGTLKQVAVWTNPDPYTSADYVTRLEQFKYNRNGFGATFAVLMTLQSMRSIAATINSYCLSEDWRMCFTELRGQNYTTYPSYNWPVSIVAHELGHLMGSQHTHACSWNGNNTAIDGCSGFVEGSCALPRPAPAGQGTIMSYCNPNINFSIGFGSQPGARIQDRYSRATCVASCPVACTYTLSPTSAGYTSSGGTGSVSVSAESTCAWTATSSASWLTVGSGASGTGNGTVTYSVATNPGTTSRTATLTVAGQAFTVSQSGGSSLCNFSISPTSASYGAGGGTGSVGVTASAGCSWTATSNASWVTVNSGASGTGSGAVGYSVALNNTTASRTGTISIAGQAFAVSQTGGAVSCTSYTSVLVGTGDWEYQPNGNWYRTTRTGTHTAVLTGPADADFDLELLKSTSAGWVVVASASGATSSERVDYYGSSGYYIWRVTSKSGAGSYDFCLSRP